MLSGLLQTNNEVFPHNAEVQLRCREPLGLYKLLGESRLQCNNGVWSSRVPSCIPTTVLTNYTACFPSLSFPRALEKDEVVTKNLFFLIDMEYYWNEMDQSLFRSMLLKQ
ncbi:hypothetical protein LSTR_LSTR014904 [Laodelphax striatellus]|uniref:Sushi domain-containing protein n=1 Tax=Laodelphax striatellus TaxID=195883 RepID=A0A482X6I0_LAOST|nr:hypothetical protein LSTR_LSTR014904 [Laodelphax striatellus]